MVLHIVNDFNHTKVHKELYYHLDRLDIAQTVFIPLRDEEVKGRHHFKFVNDRSKYVYSDKLKKIHKILFKSKIKTLYTSLIKQIDVQEIKIVHATTLFSDGAIALKLFKQFNTPYIVAVRNTDIYAFFKFRKDLIPLAREILLNASKIIFVSESNRIAFQNFEFINKIYPQIRSKVEVINNAIDDYWLKNREQYIKKDLEEYRFLFIGRFDKNKNIENLILALENLINNNKLNVKLEIVGGTGSRHPKILKLIEKKEWIKYHGIVDNKKALKDIFDRNDFFAMVSFYETFGLVYIEALSQGKAVLYTKGQGIDNMFPFKIGEKVVPRSIKDISQKIMTLINSDYSCIAHIDFECFRWQNVAGRYKEVYYQIMK